jgi:hypothetical protein
MNDQQCEAIVNFVMQHENFVFDHKLERGRDDVVDINTKRQTLIHLLKRDVFIFVERFVVCSVCFLLLLLLFDDNFFFWNIRHTTSACRFQQFFDDNLIRLFGDLNNADVNLLLFGARQSYRSSAKNRRLAYLESLSLEQDEYFSTSAMRLRDPALYHELVGDEQDQRAFDDSVGIVDRIYAGHEISEAERRRRQLAGDDNDDEHALNDDALELLAKADVIRKALADAASSSNNDSNNNINNNNNNNDMNVDNIDNNRSMMTDNNNSSNKNKQLFGDFTQDQSTMSTSQTQSIMSPNVTPMKTSNNNNNTVSSKNNNSTNKKNTVGVVVDDIDDVQSIEQQSKRRRNIDEQQQQQQQQENDDQQISSSSNSNNNLPIGVSIEEHEANIEEFRKTMIERWLYGQESDFDYSKIDDNQQYDDMSMVERDAQDAYFDED